MDDAGDPEKQAQGEIEEQGTAAAGDEEDGEGREEDCEEVEAGG